MRRLMTYRFVLAALVVLVLCASSCREDEPQPEPEPCEVDPCLYESPVSADFRIYVRPWGLNNYAADWWYNADSDTVYGYNVTFEAEDSTAEYRWYIGSGVYETRSVTLNFTNDVQPGGANNFKATLVMKKEPNTQCFPEDDGIDTLARNFHILYPASGDFRFLKFPYEGMYEGLIDGKTARTIYFDRNAFILESNIIGGGGNTLVPELKGIPNEGSIVQGLVNRVISNYTGLYSENLPYYDNPEPQDTVYFRTPDMPRLLYYITVLDDHDSVRVNWITQDPKTNVYSDIHTFEGKRKP